MSLSIVQGFSKSLAMTILSEIGDRTFVAAAILAMRYPRRHVLSGCLGSLIVMTILSAAVGWAAPNLISRSLTHHVATLLFFGFGLWSLWDAFHEEESEIAEVEAELDAASNTNGGIAKEKGDEDVKKQNRPFLSQFFSPIFLKAFSITFFGEWGDKSQIATIGLAADENPLGVVLGGILAIMGSGKTCKSYISLILTARVLLLLVYKGQALCTIAAVLGGKKLATQISERFIAFLGGVLFIVFGIQSFMSTI